MAGKRALYQGCDNPVFRWDVKPPTWHEAMETLRMTLALLSDVMPVALRHMHERPISEQIEFWRDVVEFDRDTDFISVTDDPDVIGEKINEFYDIVCERIKTPKGNIREEEVQA